MVRSYLNKSCLERSLYRRPLAWQSVQNREFVRPRSGVWLSKLLEDSLGEEVSYRMKGKMAFDAKVADFGTGLSFLKIADLVRNANRAEGGESTTVRRLWEKRI